MLEQKIISIFLITAPVLVLLKLWYLLKRQVEQDACPHNNTFTAVDSVVGTCETTTITCLDCGKRLLTKTDCR